MQGSDLLTRTVEWRGIRVEAAAPRLICGWDPPVSLRTARLAEQAVAAVGRFGDQAVGATEVAARLLLRSDGIASSAIEGLSAPVVDVALAEAVQDSRSQSSEPPSDPEPVARVAHLVADNLAVITDSLRTPGPMTTEILVAWHRRLMRHAPDIHPHHVGAWRDVLGWVGGPNPRMAAHVAVPPEDIDELMHDLVDFVNREDLDAVTQAGVSHAQFETIHPFADGNGRIGRVLIGWILRTRIGVKYPPPVSVEMARDRGGYLAGLTLYRQDIVDSWLSWFAESVADAAHVSADLLRLVRRFQEKWKEEAKHLRSDSAARRVIELLPAHPVLSARIAARLLGTSRQAALRGLVQLEDLGILTSVPTPIARRGRQENWWKAGAMFELLGG